MSLRLRNRIIIEKRSTSVDAAGQQTTSWSTVREFNAKIRDAGGREKARGDQMDSTVDAIVMIRLPREGEYPNSTMRVRYDEAGRSRTLNIMTVQKREFENNMIWLYCREND